MARLALFLVLTMLALPGCSYFGERDPLTGGADAPTSLLLDISLPRGLQRYPSHSFTASSSQGTREGLETLRGYVNASACAAALFNTLKSNGWQLRMSQRMGSRIFCLYQKGREYAALNLHLQGALTIVEIWRGPELADGASLSWGQTGSYSNEEDYPQISPEEYSPMGKEQEGGYPGSVEHWGGVEEREI